MRTLSELVGDAKTMNSKVFLQLISEVSQVLKDETRKLGMLQMTGRLIRLPRSGEVTVVGDLHGDFASLTYILADSSFMEKASNQQDAHLVFLGDYGDRGPYSPEVYCTVLNLKAKFPDKVVLLQGNHEGPEDLLAYPHDLPSHLQRRFRSDWRVVYDELGRLFRQFPTAVLADERCVMLHGGIPSKAKAPDDVAYAYERHPAESHLEEILWGDPIDGFTGIHHSPRGAGNLFGQDVTDAFIKMLGVRFVVRGHEPTDEGYKINHDGKILTLFSRKGSPYFNSDAAYVTFDLSEDYDSAWQLKPFIRKF